MSKNFKVEENDYGKRVDLFVLEKDLTLTRTSTKKLIMEGLVKVNNEAIRPNYRVRENDEVQIESDKISEFLDDTDSTSLVPTQMNLDIIHEDKDLIVINKPAGLVVHPVYTHKDDTLLNGLTYYFIKKNLEVKVRPVHRLDKETSGVILFSKNKESNEIYSKIFEEHTAEKIYYAVVEGDFRTFMIKKNRPDFFEYFTYISKEKNGDRIHFNTSKEKGLPSRTKIYFENYWRGGHAVKVYSLLKLQPLTGRTHQLRVHLSSLGFPILGDLLYSNHRYKRMMLHAYSLKLPLKTGDREFIAELPDVFE